MTVALSISCALPAPIFGVACRCVFTMSARMHVPETTVNEDSFLARAKYQVRLSWQSGIVKGVSKSERVNEPADDKLGRRILPLHGGHAKTALFGSEIVGQLC
jgi:hypothetical protein